MKRLPAKTVAFIGVFAAFHATLYLISPAFLWRNWAIYLSPIEGIVLGPWAGLMAAFIGSTIGRVLLPSPFWIFAIIAEPLSVMSAGFLTRAKWQPVIALYTVMLAAYFSPFGQSLPLWPMLDTIAAVCLVYPSSKLSKNLFSQNLKLLPVSMAIVSFVTVAADGLTRVFLFIPAGLYSSFLGLSSAEATGAFVAGGVDSFIEDAFVILVALFVGVPILLALRKVLDLRRPLS
jgi:hypothetical protein